MLESGAPSLSGVGLLQVYMHGTWSSICGATPGALTVACKSMGFNSASTSGAVAEAKTNRDTPLIGDLSCTGSESSLLDCSFEYGELDVFCAPSEAVVIHCSGDGDASGQL